MNKLLQELETAYKASSTIPVTGDAVDALALIRTKLRKVYIELEKIDSEKKAEPVAETE